MIVRSTAALLAFVLASLPLTGALAQPVPAQPDKPPPDKPAQGTPPPDKPAQDTPPPDKPPPDKPQGDPQAPVVPVVPAPVKPPDPVPAPVVAPADVVASPAIVPGIWLAQADHPVSISSGGFTVWPILLIQAQATPFVGKNASLLSGDIAERPGFRLRRARFGLGADYKSLLKGRMEADLSSDPGAELTLHEAWLGVTPRSYFGAYMGVLDVPFSRSALTSSSETALIDRPLAVRAMAPMNQIGALISGSLASGGFQYAAGIFNGLQRSDVFYSGFSQSLGGTGNRFDNLAYALRVATSLGPLETEVPAPGDHQRLFNAGASYFFSDGGARDIHSVEGDLLFQRRGVRLLAEVLYSVTAPESVPTQPTIQSTNITALGIVAEGGYTYRRLLGGHLRFEWIDPNTAVADSADNWLLTLGASFAPPTIGQYFRAQIEFTHREEVSGKSLDNDSLTLQTQFVLQ